MDLSTARRLVLKHLTEVPRQPGTAINVVDLETRVAQFWSEEQGNRMPPREGDWRVRLRPGGLPKVHEVIWDLVTQGVLTLSTVSNSDDFNGGAHSFRNWCYLRLTDYGAEVATEQRWSPYDPAAYLKALANQAPKSSKLCGIYVEEALRCFRSGSYLATAVMLGAASEGVVLDLFKSLLDAMKTNGRMPEASGYETKLNKTQSVFEKHKEFKKYFEPIRAKLPGSLNDDLDLQLDGVFNLIRYYRNSSGHPTGTQVERMAAFTSLVLFVPYCKRVEDVGNWLLSNAKELNK